MLKVRAFMNDPCGLTWKRLHEIMPRLGAKYNLEVETVSKSREAYQAEAYVATGLPAAPAVMVENEIVAQGPSISDKGVELVIRRHLGLPPGEA